jgi:hypothetical protein
MTAPHHVLAGHRLRDFLGFCGLVSLPFAPATGAKGQLGGSEAGARMCRPSRRGERVPPGNTIVLLTCPLACEAGEVMVG